MKNQLEWGFVEKADQMQKIVNILITFGCVAFYIVLCYIDNRVQKESERAKNSAPLTTETGTG